MANKSPTAFYGILNKLRPTATRLSSRCMSTRRPVEVTEAMSPRERALALNVTMDCLPGPMPGTYQENYNNRQKKINLHLAVSLGVLIASIYMVNTSDVFHNMNMKEPINLEDYYEAKYDMRQGMAYLEVVEEGEE